MIIESLLDTDLYKFTMMQCVLHQFPDANVRYRFRCRTEGVDLSPYVDEIREEIEHVCTLTMSEDELNYLGSLRFIKSDFVEFLSLFHLKPKYVSVSRSSEMPCGIDITIEGPWLHTILFEIPVLAIVNEVYFRHTVPEPDEEEGLARLAQKIRWIKNEPDNGNLKISDFGTRRRFSRAWQRKVIEVLCRDLGTTFFAGTSNVMFAKEFGLLPIGTMAHEFLQACQALGPRLRDSQVFAFERWAQEYRGDLGIALSDVYGIEPFLRDFDMYFCKLFDGARHDSGDQRDDQVAAGQYEGGCHAHAEAVYRAVGQRQRRAGAEQQHQYRILFPDAFGEISEHTHDYFPPAGVNSCMILSRFRR